MFATLLFGSLALAGPVARAPLQESGSAAGTRVLVRVIDAATGAPVGAAEVIALDHARALADWSARNVSPDLAEWEATRERLGTRARTDASGSASFERGRGALCFSASAPGRWGEATLEAGAADTIELRIEPDVTLEIAVVDELGTPAGGTAVALVSNFGRESGESAPAAFEHFLATASSDARDGIARFRHVQTLLRPQEHTRCFARLAIPLASDVELELDPTDLGGGRRTLTVPPTGRVAFDCADVPTGYVRIRRAVPGEPTRSIWFSTDPLRAEIVAGKALFERVGVGVTIEYEVRSPRQGPPIRGTAAGPASAGALVEIATPRDSAFPVLVGRVIDEDGRPVGDAKLRVGLTRHFRGEQGTGAESRGSTLVTDAAGRFQFPLRDATAPSDDRRTFDVGDGERGSAEIELPRGLSTGTLELGDVRIVAPGSTRWLESKDDSTLEAEYRRALAACELNGAHALEVETCLTEVARRGGEHWVAFLKSELERVRAAPEFGDVPEDLEVLTALRRAERKPDPLALELDGEPLFVCVFPSAPTIVCRLTNVDVGGESFGLTVGGSYRSGRFARCRAAVLDAAGNELEPLPPPGFMGGGLCSRSPLAPARSLEFSVPLGQYVAWPHAGDYRVKLLYHDETDIADDASVAGRILSSSPEFTVRVLPRKLEVTKVELARLRRCIGELDVDAAVTLVSGHWHEELRFEREPATAEDHLFRGGWTSVVVLLDALRDQGLEPKRRAVVLGMLWNIVGLHNPTSSEHAGALGAYRWLATWPGAIQPARRSMAEFGDQRGELDLAAQRKLSELWLALRDGIELSVTD